MSVRSLIDESPVYLFWGSLKVFACFSFLLSPMFSNYVFYGAVSVGDVLFLFFILYFLACARFSYSDLFLFILGAMYCCVCFYLLYQEDFNPGFFRAAFVYVTVFLMSRKVYVDCALIFRLYLGLSLFFSISLIAQWILYFAFSTTFVLQFPMPYYEVDTLNIIDHVYRSGGWFKEPSYFVLYVTPLMIYLALSRSYFVFMIVFFAGVVSTSSLIGFVALAAFLYSVLALRRFSVMCFLFVFSFAAFVVVLVFHEVLMGFIFYERIADIFISGGTLNARAGNSLVVFDVSDGVLPNKSTYSFFSEGGEDGVTWFSSFGAIAAAFGIAGLLFISFVLLRMDVYLGLMLIALMFTTHIFSGIYSIFIVLLMACIANCSFKKFGGRGEYVQA